MNDQDTLNEVVDELERFRANTGLAVNFDKTTIYKIGKGKYLNEKLLTGKNFKWSNSNIELLGVCIDIDSEKTFNKILLKMQSVMQLWRMCGLTIRGKVIMLNSLVGSLLVYPMQFLPTVSKNMQIKLKGVIEDYIWNARKPKIRTEILQASNKQGGINLFNPIAKDMSIKISWVKRLTNLDKSCKSLAMYSIKPRIKNDEFWLCNFSEKDVHLACKPTPFWKSVVQAHAKLNYHDICDINTLMEERIWLNSHIKINNNMIIIQELQSKGVMQIIDIFNEEKNRFYTVQELNEIFETKVLYLDYLSLISAIPKLWKKIIRDQKIDLSKEVEFKFDIYQKMQKVTQYAYRELNDKPKIIKDLVSNWSNRFEELIEENDIVVSLDAFKLTNVVKYSSFQYRLIHNAIFLNNRLYHCRLVDTQDCFFCEKAKETYRHLFVECEEIKPIWSKIVQYIKLNDLCQISLGYKEIILNRIVEEPTHFANLLCLITKYTLFVYKCLKKKPKAEIILDEMNFIKKCEKSKITTQKQLRTYNCKWKENINN